MARMRLRFWLALRFLMHQGMSGATAEQSGDAGRVSGFARLERFFRSLGLPAVLSFVGLTTGVAALTVAMAMVASYEKTMVGAIVDVFGHILVVNQGEETADLAKISRRLASIRPDIVGITPFINFEGIVVGQGQLNGIVAQGIDADSVDRVLRLKPRLVDGRFELGRNQAVVGKELARRFGLKVGSELKLVLPRPVAQETSGFSSRVLRYTVSGIIDLGKYDYDERTVLISIDDARAATSLRAPFVGLRLKLLNETSSFDAKVDLRRQLGADWWVSDWTDGNQNILRAIKYERIPIFLVIFVMVIAASFNVASNIFIGVLRRTLDLSILRALGLSARDVVWIFRMQGALFGFVGTALGYVLGGVLGGLFVFIQRYFVILPPDVYRISHVGVEFYLVDVFVIGFASVLICLVASLAPAAKAARLIPVDGLRHE